MLHVVHHPDYVVPAKGKGTFRHDKYALVMDALRDSGVAMTACPGHHATSMARSDP